jgi:hypothetical protein
MQVIRLLVTMLCSHSEATQYLGIVELYNYLIALFAMHTCGSGPDNFSVALNQELLASKTNGIYRFKAKVIAQNPWGLD